MTSDKTFVTQPYLPPLEEFLPYLEQIWDSKVLTNGGPFHQQLENDLAEHLGVSELALFTNGTLALVTALQALRITGEVITTPFSYVATSHAFTWIGQGRGEIGFFRVPVDACKAQLTPEKSEAERLWYPTRSISKSADAPPWVLPATMVWSTPSRISCSTRT